MTGPGLIGQAAGDDKATRLKETRDAAKELLGELKDRFRELRWGKTPVRPRVARSHDW